jgi:hypothetical protein
VSAEDVVGFGHRGTSIAVLIAIGPLMSFISRHSEDAAALLGVLAMIFLCVDISRGLYRRKKVERPAIALSETGISWALSTGKWKQFPWAVIAKVDLKATSDKGSYRHRLSLDTTEGEPNSIDIYDKLGKPVNFRQLAAQIANRVEPSVLGPGIKETLKDPEYLSDKGNIG